MVENKDALDKAETRFRKQAARLVAAIMQGDSEGNVVEVGDENPADLTAEEREYVAMVLEATARKFREGNPFATERD